MSFFEDTEDQIKEAEKNTLWTEHYRPKSLDDYIGNDFLKSKLKLFIDNGDIPHLLFHGRSGTGKSTAAKMIVNTIECDYLFINASDENNVETIRNKVKGFASTVGFKDKKIIVLDECDYISPQGQAILRNLMETFSKHCRFILTCNYPERIIEALQSRCQTFEVIPPSKKEIAIHISKILQKESVEFNPTDLVPIIDNAYPDIRKIINTCQLSSSKGKLVPDKKNTIESDYKNKIIDVLKKKNEPARNRFKEIRQIIANSRLQDFTDMYRALYDKLDEYVTEDNIPFVILIIADGLHRDALVVDKEIQFVSTISQILEVK